MWKTGEDACWLAFVLGDKFFSCLQEIDQEIARQVARAGCPRCGGPLDRSDYDRKPRGDRFIAATAEPPVRRISYCCRREGCRRRRTPPSVVFLGRRVYLGAVVIVASASALLRRTTACPPAQVPPADVPPAEVAPAQASPRRTPATQVPARTLGRWSRWWQTELPVTGLFVALRGLLASPVDAARLPCSLLERLTGSAVEQVTALLKLLAPLSTGSVADGARFLRSAGA
ncbi:uncharacterized protein SOCEGT47_038760 [Sorangium cellulosum]|uniref:Transposase n=1 Tax=Sorangium cellulosum TaxID=56 RepID=A0A4P2Q390_SORCE|nr:hypothetical protein [Sorangium cellulosum]AUX23353.1 uncharacterized protein SOCEGT47_038760 [Sorangium cellulosum]